VPVCAWRSSTVSSGPGSVLGQRRESFPCTRKSRNGGDGATGKASLALYPEFVGWIEEISGKNAGFRPKGTLEALFSEDTKRSSAPLSHCIMAWD